MTPRRLLAASAVILLPAMAAAQQPGPDVTRQVQQQVAVPLPSLSPLVERVNPAVVNVSVVMSESEQEMAEADDSAPGAGQSPMEDFLRRFFDQQGIPGGSEGQRPRARPGPGTRQGVALGSGFIIESDGSVVTNNHVVGNADKVTVIFPDNSKHPAKVVGR